MRQRSTFLRPLYAALTACLLAHAAPASADTAAAAAPAPAAAPIDPVKKKLIEEILTHYHPESIAVYQVQQFGTDTMQKANMMMHQNHMQPDVIDRTMKDISTDVQKYINTITPVVTADANREVEPAVAPILAQNLSVEELQQLLAMLQNPVRSKFEKLVPQLEHAILLKVHNDLSAEVEKDVNAMNKAAGTKLQAAVLGSQGK